MSKQTHAFEAEVSQVLKLVINSLYSNKEVFLRELVSNASDALDKRRFQAIQKPDLIDEGEQLKIRIIADKEKGTLTIWDNGIGMTRDELQQSLGTVAWSGSKAFVEALKEANDASTKEPQLIGQFGVGFYSAYLVADNVTVVSRGAGTGEAYRWESTGQNEFTIEAAERDSVGTSVTLHLKDEYKEFLEDFRLRGLVNRYSDFLAHPIEMPKKGESSAQEFEAVNQASALWQRSPKEVKEEQYEEFYKHLSHDWEAPLAHRHFHIEGTQMFTGLLFVPRRAPFDLFDAETRHGVRLHVRRVFVRDNADELVPRWLRFVRGVVDSEDLPLNVSREVLQDSKAVRIIRKQVTNQVLDALEEMAKERPDDYRAFWETFGAVLKEGLHFEPEFKERVSQLLRYESSSREGLVSLAEYVETMKEDQEAIYYATGASRDIVKSSPHLEQLSKRGFEVLLMFDAVDPFALENLTEYEGKKLKNVMAADLDLSESNSEGEDAEGASKQASVKLIEKIKEVLAERVSEVKTSTRLEDSPACLVIPEGGLAPHIERMLRARNQGLPFSKRILEINAKHPLIQKLESLCENDAADAAVSDWIKLVHDQALLAEGSPIEDPAQFAKRLTTLMTRAAASA